MGATAAEVSLELLVALAVAWRGQRCGHHGVGRSHWWCGDKINNGDMVMMK